MTETQVGGIAAAVHPEIQRLALKIDLTVKPFAKRKTRSISSRFVNKITVASDGCFVWSGSKSQVGYGWFSWASKPVLAHRWIYEAAIGPIPNKKVIDHLCRNRACVNPLHLECVSMGENTRRGTLHDVQRAKAKQKTRCTRGHDLFGENLKLRGNGHRMCIACQRMKADEWRKNNRAQVNMMQSLRRSKGRK